MTGEIGPVGGFPPVRGASTIGIAHPLTAATVPNVLVTAAACAARAVTENEPAWIAPITVTLTRPLALVVATSAPVASGVTPATATAPPRSAEIVRATPAIGA